MPATTQLRQAALANEKIQIENEKSNKTYQAAQ